MTNNPIKMHIQECPNLLKFVENFGKKFFADELKSYEMEKPNISSNDLTNNETKDLSKHWPKIVSLLVALGAMTLYAIRNGIFSVS